MTSFTYNLIVTSANGSGIKSVQFSYAYANTQVYSRWLKYEPFGVPCIKVECFGGYDGYGWSKCFPNSIEVILRNLLE